VCTAVLCSLAWQAGHTHINLVHIRTAIINLVYFESVTSFSLYRRMKLPAKLFPEACTHTRRCYMPMLFLPMSSKMPGKSSRSTFHAGSQQHRTHPNSILNIGPRGNAMSRQRQSCLSLHVLCGGSDPPPCPHYSHTDQPHGSRPVPASIRTGRLTTLLGTPSRLIT
jgi:hypothetical protein